MIWFCIPESCFGIEPSTETWSHFCDPVQASDIIGGKDKGRIRLGEESPARHHPRFVAHATELMSAVQLKQ